MSYEDFRPGFPDNFIWGAASSAYQTEGSWDSDGKGPSIWDTFCHDDSGSNIAYGHSGDTACDHYHRFEEDLKLMQSLGIKAYRFSISWPRIFPAGDQTLNPAGLAFYDRLTDRLIEYGITPFITLYHWDLPQALEDKGGWQSRETAEAFSEYAAFVCEHFSDRVSDFMTINEPQIISRLGYFTGDHAPGLKLSQVETMNVIHNLLLAHGMAVSAMRKSAKKPVCIGFASTGNLFYPPEECSTEDILKAKELSFEVSDSTWDFCHTIFCDAACNGRYPDFNGRPYSEIFPFIQEGDMAVIHQPVDFLGVNIYNGHCADSSGVIPREPGFPRTACKWPVTPGVINYGIQFLYERYSLPIYISENGTSCNDRIFLDGKVHDADRIDFLQSYLLELKKAYDAGTDIRGYFHWSFTDNFEWHSGFEERFGLVFVDYNTQRRIPKDSAYWYSRLISHESSNRI